MADPMETILKDKVIIGCSIICTAGYLGFLGYGVYRQNTLVKRILISYGEKTGGSEMLPVQGDNGLFTDETHETTVDEI
jgi:hypothetical protein